MRAEGTVIVDDANPMELMTKYLVEKDADIFIGGVKEKPIAYKLGEWGSCDHNHERKTGRWRVSSAC